MDKQLSIHFEVNKEFVGEWHKWQMTPTVTLQKILVFHHESSLKGLLRPWRSRLIKQCHLQWITLPLNVGCVCQCMFEGVFVCVCFSVSVLDF